MQLREIFKVTKGTKVILAVTFSVSVAAIIFAYFYYSTINRSADPRVSRAGEYLQRFEKVSGQLSSIDAWQLLDSAYTKFISLPDYKESYEIGVINNNKCSSLLLNAIYDSTISEGERRVLLDLSMKYCDSSIRVYKRWIQAWENRTQAQISHFVGSYMKPDDPAFEGRNYQRLLNRRIKDLQLAQVETPRRLSVSLTNKGTIYRHMAMTDSSLYYFGEALNLWKENRIARSNLSVLMGGEPVKPNIIQSLFPPDKRKK